MAAPSYTEDLSDITLAENTTGWSALGGGASGLSASPDISMEGTNCVDKQITAAEKGQVFSAASPITPGSAEHFFVWAFVSTPGLTDTLANRGLAIIAGTSTSAYVAFHVEGIDTYGAAGRVGRCYPIRYDNTSSGSPPYRTLTGTPGTSPQVFGATANITASVKGANLGVDAIRRGTGAYLTAGELISAGDASDNPCTFTGFATTDITVTNRWGIMLPAGGGNFELQGRFAIGQDNTGTPTLARFRASNQTILCVDTPHALPDFTQVIVDHASTRCEWTNISVVGLGTTNPGRIVVTANNPVLVWTGGNNANIGTTTLRSNSTTSGVSWRGCGQITANGATMLASSISGYEGTADTSALVWDTADDPDGMLDGSSFTKGSAATHAIEFGVTSPTSITLRGMAFSGYNAANGQNDSTFHVRRTTGTVTINLVGCSGNASYRTDGASVVLVVDPVTLTVTAADAITGSPVQGAWCTVVGASTFTGGTSVSITQTGGTATVTHTAHGFSTGDSVRIYGANESAYNGFHQITVTGANTYTYSVDSGTSSPATGSPVSAILVIAGLTDSSGQITDTRSWTSDQIFSGRVRKGTSGTVYKSQPIAGTIDSSAGASITAPMAED